MTEYLEVATYGRNSDKVQTTSQAIQTDVFQHFVEAEDGFKRLFGKPARIVENYKDHGKSASKKLGKRTDFDRMLNDVATGKVKIVLVLNTSRFSRLHPIDTLNFLNTFRNSGAHLVSVEDRKVIEIEELGDLITNIVKFSSDHEYARSLSANILRGTILAIKEDATAHVSLIPYGMAKLVITDTGEERTYPRTNNMRLPSKSKGGKKTWFSYLVAGDETEVEIVRWIFNTYLEDDISFCEMARRLNHHKNPMVRAGYAGKGWDDCRIKTILKNRHYRAQEFIGVDCKGEHYRAVEGQAVATKQAKELKPLIVEGKYPPVVNPDVFEKVQQKLRRKKGSKPKCLNTDGCCLTGSLVCGHCGHKMITTGHGKYVCKSGRSGKSSCRQWGIEEHVVLPWLIARIDKEILRRLQDEPEILPDVDAEKVRQQIANIDSKMETVKVKLADVSTSVEVCRYLTDTLAALGTEKERLQSQLRDDTYHQRLGAAYDRWEEMVKPYLVGLKTGNVGEGNPAVKHLDLQDEIDRLFNFTDAKPSKVRELLQSMETEVVCHFTVKEADKRSKGKRVHFNLDHGAVSVTIQGVSTPLQQRDIRPRVNPLPNTPLQHLSFTFKGSELPTNRRKVG